MSYPGTTQSEAAGKPATGMPMAADAAPQLAAARHGDAEAFNQLTEPHRGELRVHCYRILGSLVEAEDMVQETFLRAWKRLDTFQGRSTFRAWLYKIATNACLDTLAANRSRRLLPQDRFLAADPQVPIVPPATEVTWLEPYPDELLVDRGATDPEARYSIAESVSLAFLAALQTLPPRQRAVLILTDVLEWSAREVAELIGATEQAIASSLHRARARMSATYHGHASEASPLSAANPGQRALLERYVRAWQSADVDALVGLLKEDAVLSMPPSPSWYQGREAIGGFVAATLFANEGMFGGQADGRWRLQPTRANGQPAFIVLQRGAAGDFQPSAIHVLDLQGSQLAGVTCFLDPRLPGFFRVEA